MSSVRLPDPERSYAVLIGVGAYQSPGLTDLAAVGNNVTALSAALTSPSLGGLPTERCVVIRDPASVRTVYRTLRQYAAIADDTLLIYFAGHGSTGPRNELYLCLADTDLDELPVSALAFDLIRGIFGDSPAANRVFILDCCFSGRAISDMGGTSGAISGQLGIQGSYTLTSTSANEVALAPPGARYTAFTGELIDIISTGIPGGCEFLTFGAIYRRLLSGLIARGLPQPEQRGTGTVDQLALTRNAAYLPQEGVSIEPSRSFNERFAAATEQLGRETEPAIRLAGVYAMAGLADDWEEGRQTCINALCAYLRLPEPAPGQDAPRELQMGRERSQEVRHTLIKTITAHLKETGKTSWQGYDFDFTGVLFDGGDFAEAIFTGGRVKFSNASLKNVSFASAVFSGGYIDFRNARFSNVDFVSAHFSGAYVDFRYSEFAEGDIEFGRYVDLGAVETAFGAIFSSGTVDFREAHFSGATVRFTGASFDGATVSFSNAKFTDGFVTFGAPIDITGAVFSAGTISFSADFSGARVSFNEAKFAGSSVNFSGAKFSGSVVTFINADFSGGAIRFIGTEFSAGHIDFREASFAAGKVDFTHAKFSGASVDLSHARGDPPILGWRVKKRLLRGCGMPPAGRCPRTPPKPAALIAASRPPSLCAPAGAPSPCARGRMPSATWFDLPGARQARSCLRCARSVRSPAGRRPPGVTRSTAMR